MSKDFEKSLRQLKTGREILLALKGYGALSQRTLRYILKSSSKGKVVLALWRLRKLGVIQRISYKFEDTQGAYYYFDSRLDRRILLAEYLGCDADDLKLECIRHVELPHEQRCARVQFDLNQMFPAAKTYRDYQLDRAGMSGMVFPAMAIERRVYPDVLLHYVDNTREHGECFVAFEVEESLKSKARLFDKLNRYATESLLDGVVYLSTESQIISTVAKVFTDKVLAENLRIKHYGRNFLMFQKQTMKHDGVSELAMNLDSKTIPLHEWMMSLMHSTNTERRNSQSGVGVSTPHGQKLEDR